MERSEFNYSAPFTVTNEMKESFGEKGYVLIRGLLEKDELQKIKSTLEGSEEIQRHSFVTDDSEGRKSRVSLWCQPGNDVTGMLSRSQRVAGTSAELLGGEVYHYYTKLMMKEARTGGRFVWHQDYGYWYNNGNLYPDMLSVFVAIDKCEKANGCLQVLEGSHKCGRIEHSRVGGQMGADMDRVEQLRSRLPHKYMEMNPGDALFFHCNVLHTNAANVSDKRRWVFIACYNKASNDPVIEHHYPRYNKLDIVDDKAIRECTNVTDMDGKAFLDPSDNKTIEASRG
ncbi:L-proline trans-4-hydroxylase-like [Haliotis rubra]|uniref:L-proline trans-4-hydroxylase-like n=1 Tax=Haliotis rubra TaxID=36100 RepID=UPI001EE5BEDE|nr:L-proline trans-4-hydroxylase-like [Haliotis rubra]